MPNWCSTTLAIYSKNHSEIEAFHEKLQEIILMPFDTNVHAASWLGNMCMHAGYTYDEVIADVPGYCRGWIQYVGDIKTLEDENISYFYVSVEDAWEQHIHPWRSTINRLYPNNNIKIAWLANECGCEIYQKYDPYALFFSDSEYCMDCYVDNNEAYQKHQELQEGCDDYTAAKLIKIFGLPNMDAIQKKAEEITEALEKEYGEGYMYIYRYEELDSEY